MDPFVVVSEPNTPPTSGAATPAAASSTLTLTDAASPLPPTTTAAASSPPALGPGDTVLSLIRALDEVQLLDKRIEKKVSESSFIAMLSKKNRQTLVPDAFSHSAKSDWQSLQDLISRRHAIKSAILQSNATTIVQVAGERLTIAEVIERKKSLALHTSLLTKLKTQRESVLRSIETNNGAMDAELQKLLEIHFGKGGGSAARSSSNSSSSDVEEISKSFRESNSARLLDPIGLDGKIRELEAYVEQFEREIKFILSESNALTKIVIRANNAEKRAAVKQQAQAQQAASVTAAGS